VGIRTEGAIRIDKKAAIFYHLMVAEGGCGTLTPRIHPVKVTACGTLGIIKI
jgi:hypothetical protein